MTTANLNNEKFFLDLIKSGTLRVTKSGRAFNLKTNKEIALRRKENVYRKLSWKNHNSGKIVQVQLHRIVWAYFMGPPKNEKLQINHKDGNKANCALSNLEVTTNSGNVRHALETGLNVPLKGEQQVRSVFSDREVRMLRKRFVTGRIGYSELATEIGVNRVTLLYALRGASYKHVKSRYDNSCRAMLPIVGRGNKIER